MVRDIPVYYEVYGEGFPIILIHGYTPDHRLMTGCMEPVFADRPGWQRIYLDLPGMGRTPGAEWINGTDDMLAVVLEFIDKVIPDQHFLLAGESYGGYLSRGVVLRRPELVDGLALICPTVIGDAARRDLPPHTVLLEDPQLLASLDPAEAEEFSSIAVVQDKYNWERFRDEILSGLKIADAAFLQKIKQNYSYTFEVDQLPQPFGKPALIFTGRQDDCVGYRDAWRLLENYPRASFAVLDRAGHNAHVEQTELFNALVNEWLNRVQESQGTIS